MLVRSDVDQEVAPQVSRSAKAAAAATRWLSYLTVNPIAALAALALTSGGLLVLFFFLRIGFMPDVDFATSTALLFSVALVWIGTVVIYMLVAVLPGVVTAYALDEHKIAPDPWTLASVVGGSLLTISVILVDAWLNGGRSLASWPWIGWLSAIAAVLLVMARVAWLRCRPTQDEARQDLALKGGYWQVAFLLSFSAIMWLLGLITALQLALHLARESNHPPWMSGVLIVIWLGLLVFANLVTVRLPLRAALIFAPIVGVLVFTVLVLISEGLDGISMHALRRLGLAEMEQVDLIVRSDVCKSLRLTSATALRCDGQGGGDAGVLRNVVVRSRIGTQLVVEPMGKGDGAAPSASNARTPPAARLILKKEDVLMWAKREGR